MQISLPAQNTESSTPIAICSGIGMPHAPSERSQRNHGQSLDESQNQKIALTLIGRGERILTVLFPRRAVTRLDTEGHILVRDLFPRAKPAETYSDRKSVV